MTADPAKAEKSEKLIATVMWEDGPFEKTEIKKVSEELYMTKMRLTARRTEASISSEDGEEAGGKCPGP